LPKTRAKARPEATPREEWKRTGYRMDPMVQHALRMAAVTARTDIEIYLDGVMRKHLSDLGLLATVSDSTAPLRGRSPTPAGR
jgi:hypothetical protein